jgi:hypothetical protein
MNHHRHDAIAATGPSRDRPTTRSLGRLDPARLLPRLHRSVGVGRQVTSRDGRVWSIRRRIAGPRRRSPDIGLPPIELDPTGLAFLVLLPIIVAIVLVAIASLAFVLVEGAVVVAAAYLWKGRWTVEAVTVDGGETRTWDVRGWSASRRKVNEVARELAA